MIYIFTHSYPYARRGEVFLNDEMRAVQTMGLADEVRFVPLCREKGVPVSACPTVRSEPCLLGVSEGVSWWKSLWRSIRIGIGMVCQPLFWRMPADFNRRLSFRANLRQGTKYFYAAWAYADWIRRNRHVLKSGDIIYSYWAHYNVLGMALAKRKGWLPSGVRCISRGHRYDIYDEACGRYFPYRRFSLAVLDGLFPCSVHGAECLRQRFPEMANKIATAFLGVWPKGNEDATRIRALRPTEKVVRVVSCALVSPVKRLPLLWRSLAEFSAQLPADVVLEWHHFGGGAGLSALQAEAAAKATGYPGLKTVWHGQTDNAKLRETYLNVYFHVFVNVSESEGLPVSFMEAFAAGIPVLATDVGGSGELVRLGGGCPLPKGFTQSDFNQAMEAILQAGDAARHAAYQGYLTHFSAERNYEAFYRKNVHL